MPAWQLRDFFTQVRGRDRGIEPSTLFSPLLLCYFTKLVFLQPHRQMLRTLNNLSYVQEGLFPQNETAQNRICREKSEFDKDSATLVWHWFASCSFTRLKIRWGRRCWRPRETFWHSCRVYREFYWYIWAGGIGAVGRWNSRCLQCNM